MGSRRIVGFALGEHHDTNPAQAALQMAVAVRGGKDTLTEVIMHTDQGSEYTSTDFAELAKNCTVTLSVGRTGQCWDNALAESFFASLKGECLDPQSWPTRAAARRAIVEYIAWHNGTRLHSALGCLTPTEYVQAARKETLQQVA